MSSHVADEEHRESGRAETDAKHVLALLQAAYKCRPYTSSGITYRELAASPACTLDHHAVMKRLCDNERLCLVEKIRDYEGHIIPRKCSIGGKRCSQWRPV